MFQAFVIVLREGFEAFLLIAFIYSYLVKVRRSDLLPPVYWGIGVSLLTSFAFGYLIWITANGPLWEGIFGAVTAVFVTWFVIHMWLTAPHLKKDIEIKLDRKTHEKVPLAARLGVFLFTVFTISREGMETALLLIQVRQPQIILGICLGLLAAAGVALLWVKFGRLINLKLFFQVTAIFLLLFVFQVLIYSFHEFTEAGVLPYSEALHLATEPFSPEGIYGRWFTFVMIGACVLWLLGAWTVDRLRSSKPSGFTK